ncbi:MAG: tetratricopeptide repeat protein [Candidatus Cloacimonas sp.]|nr:tetratricopeptide repeat protein [Candidatus Cloacimonas sp.]
MKIRDIIICMLCLTGIFACEVNTLFNARNYFKSAQSRPLTSNGRPNAQAIDEYTKAIKKCGKIISTDKKGKRVEEAYYLMAKSLYYKGNSAFQAKDQFQNLVIRFPDSKYVPEAYIYIAKILRETNQPKEAEKLLDEFLRNPKYRKNHPEALFVLADFAIKDEDFIKAQHYLERIITEYPKTKEYREAYFLFGKNYYEQKDYDKSLEAFKKMQKARGIDKTIKLEGTYYIGLNELELGQAEKALKTAKSLIKSESRPDKIPFVRLLKARAQFALGDTTAARTEIEFITKNYPRTEGSANACYYLGEYYYYTLGDIPNAVLNYNRVRTEFSNSPLAKTAQAKATALGLIAPRAGLDCETGLSQFLDYHYQAAESFLNVLSLPDSAITRYQIVIAQKDTLIVKLDSLQTAINKNNAILDSLRAILPAPETPAVDSLGVLEQAELTVTKTDITSETAFSETPAEIVISSSDSLKTFADTLQIVDSEIPVTDSLLIEETISAGDSLAIEDEKTQDNGLPNSALEEEKDELTPLLTETAETDSLTLAIGQHIQNLEKENERYSQRLEKLEEIIERFDSEIIPFCMFAIGSIYHNHSPESPENSEIMAKMQEQYPDNKFTKALYALQNNLPVRLIDPKEEKAEQLLDMYLEQIYTAPDSALAGLQELTNSPYHKIKLAANYRLGWYYSFEQIDTLLAKPYLKAVLDEPEAGEYAIVARRFFDGNNYLLRGAPVISLPETDTTAVDSLGADIKENIKDWSFPSPAEIYATLPDSLKIYSGIPGLMDSLAKAVFPEKENREEKNISPEMETPEENIPQPEENPVPALPEEPIQGKKEEPLLE